MLSFYWWWWQIDIDGYVEAQFWFEVAIVCINLYVAVWEDSRQLSEYKWGRVGDDIPSCIYSNQNTLPVELFLLDGCTCVYEG
jgi:hypothetical protein